MSKTLAIPYTGSKAKLAKKIIDKILEENPNCNYFYDLFGGGGAISIEALQRPNIKKLIYNELKTSIVELLKKIIRDGVSVEEFCGWISREEFFDLKDGDDWKAGLLTTCWSFGNLGKGYIYGKKIEVLKKELHDYLISNGYNFRNRIELLKNGNLNYMQIQHLERIEHLERIDIQHLIRIEHLDRISKFEMISKDFSIFNLSYDVVPIDTPTEETIIYCDIPYQNTGVSYNSVFNYDKFYEWVKNNKYKIYISEYDFPGREVASFPKVCYLAGKGGDKKTIEKLFCNYEK